MKKCRLCLNKRSNLVEIYKENGTTANEIYLITGVVVRLKEMLKLT